MEAAALQEQTTSIPVGLLGRPSSMPSDACHHPFTLTTGGQLARNETGLTTKWPQYVADLLEMFSLLPADYFSRPFLIRFGDCIAPSPYPVLSKARQIGDSMAILLPLNYDRHFGWLMRTEPVTDFPFWDKAAKVFWRGSTTDGGWDPSRCAPENHRRALVENWALSKDARVDVGLHQLAQDAKAQPGYRRHWQRYMKTASSVPDQLVHRYMIAAEGNDVATGLKWMLASNSVVLMPPPRRETWLRESQLQPWVHYVPLSKDFSDLLEKVDWCERHLLRCFEISQNAMQYTRQFSDRALVMADGARQLQAYLDNVHVALSYGG